MTNKQHAAADAAFENFDFSDFGEIEDCDGWEWTEPGSHMTRPVYFLTEEGDTKRGYFSVSFESADSSKIIEAYANTLWT